MGSGRHCSRGGGGERVGERRGGGGFWAQRVRGAEEEERSHEVPPSHDKPETAEAALGELEILLMFGGGGGERGGLWAQRVRGGEEQERLHEVPLPHYKPETAEAALDEWMLGTLVQGMDLAGVQRRWCQLSTACHT